jgi:hypothetical protein
VVIEKLVMLKIERVWGIIGYLFLCGRNRAYLVRVRRGWKQTIAFVNQIVLMVVQLCKFPVPNFEWESIMHQQRLYTWYWNITGVDHHFVIDFMA